MAGVLEALNMTGAAGTIAERVAAEMTLVVATPGGKRVDAVALGARVRGLRGIGHKTLGLNRLGVVPEAGGKDKPSPLHFRLPSDKTARFSGIAATPIEMFGGVTTDAGWKIRAKGLAEIVEADRMIAPGVVGTLAIGGRQWMTDVVREILGPRGGTREIPEPPEIRETYETRETREIRARAIRGTQETREMLATTTKEMREAMPSEMHVMCIAAATLNAMVVTTADVETTVATETTAETTGVKDNVNAAGAAAPPVNDRGPLSGMCSEVMDTVGMKSGMSSEHPVESPSCASRTSMRSSTKLWCATDAFPR